MVIHSYPQLYLFVLMHHIFDYDCKNDKTKTCYMTCLDMSTINVLKTDPGNNDSGNQLKD
jgi:hypothetical protein